MHITKVELENIKSHVDSTFEFFRGTTAITGPNGSGKTTIIEAIAWTIFDLLDYKKDDLLRRGAKKGSARVSFISSLDEREYTAYRDTATGYYIQDPALQLRVADKKEDVTRFLRQHLGVGPGTDLEALFRHAVGVPQGTLTAIFLATPAERKRTFDTLLKVEEYRRAADELIKTQRFIETRIVGLGNTIHKFEGELARADEVNSELKRVRTDSERMSDELRHLRDREKQLAEKLVTFEQGEKAEERARKEKERLKAEAERAEILFNRVENELNDARQAAEKLDAVRPEAELHIAALARLSELERERAERDKLRLGSAKLEAAEFAVQTEAKHIRSEIDQVEKAHVEITSLSRASEVQTATENEISELKEKIAELRSTKQQAAKLDERLEKLRERFASARAELDAARAGAAGAERTTELQARESRIIGELARLRANLERDERFQNEIRSGLCPILSEKCLNIKDGQTLEGFLKDQFTELRSAVGALESEHAALTAELRSAREAEVYAGTLKALEQRCEEIGSEGQQMRAERDELERRTLGLGDLESELRTREEKLAGLGDPRTRIAYLRERLLREPDLRARLTETESNMERLESDRRLFAEQLERYSHVDEQWAAATEKRDRTADLHRTFVAFERAADGLPGREAEFTEVKTSLDLIKDQMAAAEAEYSRVAAGYDRDAHAAARSGHQELQKEIAVAEVRQHNANERQNELERESARLAEIRNSLSAEMAEKERQEKLLETTVFIRDTLKEAAPLVARNYVFHVSVEANLLFRDITGNAERTLKWAEDYGIILEEDGFNRPFQSLSGGEQMAAALSVRLALLKQLSDIRIAFFDEPTANMDAERRENLALQIGQISHFDQLFVISHDDTFEGYMDHEVSLDGK